MSKFVGGVRASRFKWSEWDDAQTISFDEESISARMQPGHSLKRDSTLGFGLFGAKRKKAQIFRRRDSRGARLLYMLERVMVVYGRFAQILLLIFVGGVQIALYGLLYSIVWRYEEDADPRPEKRVSRYIESFWHAWTFMSDGGTHAKAFHAEQRIVGGLISIMGIIYLATILAFIVDIVREKMDDMRVGKGQVLETDHTVILHWTDRTIPLLFELCIANESEGGGVLVVLAKDPIETMRTELSLQLPEFVRRGTKIVLRHGNPAVVSDLIKVSADQAKAVVCLASGKKAGEADSATLRCILSMKSMGYALKGHIVAEVQDGENESLLRLIGGKMIETFVVDDVVGHLLLMSVQQPGLATVYDALLGFEGNEVYMKKWPELAGVSFGDLTERFPDAIPIGVRGEEGDLWLNPSRDYKLGAQDELIVIAEDNDTYKPEVPADVSIGTVPRVETKNSYAEKILICGWRRDIREILTLIDSSVMVESEVHTMTHHVPAATRNDLLRDDGLRVEELQNIKVIHHDGNPSIRRRLEMLPVELFTSCLIFADQAYEDDTMQADSHSLATLVLVRDIQSQRRNRSPNGCQITCEILDLRTQRTLAGQKQLQWICDFVHSNKFVARILAMIAETRSVKGIISKFLGAKGCSLSTTPACEYVLPEEYVSWYTVAKRVQLNGAILIGFQSQSRSRKTVLNPSDKMHKRRWDNCSLIVISADSITATHLAKLSAECDAFSKTVEAGSSSGSSALTRALETWPIQLHELTSLQLEEDSSSGEFRALDEGEICASADTAMRALTMLADKFARLWPETEQHRLGSSLISLGQQIQDGEL